MTRVHLEDELDNRELDFIAIYGAVFGRLLEKEDRVKVRAAIKKELLEATRF